MPLEVAEKFCAGVFRKFISENTSIPVFGNELPNCIRSAIFFVFPFVSHINRFQLFTGTCQATNQHASDRVKRPRLRRLDANGRRRSWRRPRDGGRVGDDVCEFLWTWERVPLHLDLGVGWLEYLLPASERRRRRSRWQCHTMSRRGYRMLTLHLGRRMSRRTATRECPLTLPC